MAILKRIHIFFLLPIFLTGCFQEFEPDIDTDPVLCVNSLITAGEPVTVNVTHTWVYNQGDVYRWDSYDETQPPVNHVDDAKVYVYANDKLTSGNYIAEEGDTIRIVAESVKYGSAEATVVVPVAVPVSLENVRPQLLRIWKNSASPLNVTMYFNLWASLGLGQTLRTDEYFRLRCRALNHEGETGGNIYWSGNGFYGDEEDRDTPYANIRLGNFDGKSDPVFGQHVTILDSTLGSDDGTFMCFTNHLFAGRGYDLRVRFDEGYFSVYSPEYDPDLFDCQVEFTLMTISGSYYNALLYEWELENGALGEFNDTGLADSIWGYSNVSTNAGVVAARSISTCSVSLRDFFKTAFNEDSSTTY